MKAVDQTSDIFNLSKRVQSGSLAQKIAKNGWFFEISFIGSWHLGEINTICGISMKTCTQNSISDREVFSIKVLSVGSRGKNLCDKKSLGKYGLNFDRKYFTMNNRVFRVCFQVDFEYDPYFA